MGLWDFFFEPKCPVPPEHKQWLERRMAWLINEFGLKRLRQVRVITPTPEFFPDRYDATRDAACDVFHRVRDFMGVDASRIRLRFFNEGKGKSLGDLGIPFTSKHSGAAGLHTMGEFKSEIALNESNFDRPEALVATVAHELCHAILIGEGHLRGDEEDNEPLTDLATVFFGLGVFNANSAIYFRQFDGAGTSGYESSQLGYLNIHQFAYAHSLFALARNEEEPTWARHLRPDVRKGFHQGLKYLRKTGDLEPDFFRAAGL